MGEPLLDLSNNAPRLSAIGEALLDFFEQCPPFERYSSDVTRFLRLSIKNNPDYSYMLQNEFFGRNWCELGAYGLCSVESCGVVVPWC